MRLSRKPCRLLRRSNGAINLIRTDAVLAVHNLPHGHHPFVQADGAVFHDRASLQGELWGAALLAALPGLELIKEQNVLRPATRAGDTVGPATRNQVLTAVCGGQRKRPLLPLKCLVRLPSQFSRHSAFPHIRNLNVPPFQRIPTQSPGSGLAACDNKVE